jgi:hypothetical protein
MRERTAPTSEAVRCSDTSSAMVSERPMSADDADDAADAARLEGGRADAGRSGGVRGVAGRSRELGRLDAERAEAEGFDHPPPLSGNPEGPPDNPLR